MQQVFEITWYICGNFLKQHGTYAAIFQINVEHMLQFFEIILFICGNDLKKYMALEKGG